MKKKMFIHYNPEGDYLEVRFGKATPSYFEPIGDDTFERRDEETKEVKGYAFFNVKKRENQKGIEVDIPISA